MKIINQYSAHSSNCRYDYYDYDKQLNFPLNISDTTSISSSGRSGRRTKRQADK